MYFRLADSYRRQGPFYRSCRAATASRRRPRSVRSRPPATASRCRDCPTFEYREEEVAAMVVGKRRELLGRKAF